MVAMVGMDAWSIEKDMFADGYGDTEMIAIDGYRCEIVDGMKLGHWECLFVGESRQCRVSESVVVGSPTFRGGGGHDTDRSNMDEGSIEDDERSTWTDSAFYTAFGTFPSAADGPQPTVVFSDRLLSEEVLTDSAVSVHEELPMLALRIPSNVGVTVIPPVVDRPVMARLVGKDNRMDEVSI